VGGQSNSRNMHEDGMKCGDGGALGDRCDLTWGHLLGCNKKGVCKRHVWSGQVVGVMYGNKPD